MEDSPFASSPPNLVFVYPLNDEGNPFFQTLPDSPENSFNLYELKVSPVIVPLIWPPPEYTLTARASPAGRGKVIVQQHKIGGIGNSRYPIRLVFSGITGVNKIELTLAMTYPKALVLFALDDIVIGWKSFPKTSIKQAVMRAKDYRI